MGAAKRTKEVWTTYKGKRRQVKSYGICEPKNRVKGYRVEIRPPNSKMKIWVGTFKTRAKAERAYDVAVYLIGREPYYHVYPENYFPRRPSLSNFSRLKAMIQTEAKKYAEKSGPLQVNPLSLIDHISTTAAQGSTIPKSLESHQPTSVDRKVILAAEENSTNTVEEVDKEIDLKPIQQEEFYEFSYTKPCCDYLPSNSWPYLEDLQGQESVEDYDAKMPVAAYLRGLNAPNTSVVINELLDCPPLRSFNVFPHIQGTGDSILDLFEEDSSLKLIPLEREHESPDASTAQFDDTRMTWSTLAAMSKDDCTSVGDGSLRKAYEDHPMEDGEVDRYFELEQCGYLIFGDM